MNEWRVHDIVVGQHGTAFRVLIFPESQGALKTKKTAIPGPHRVSIRHIMRCDIRAAREMQVKLAGVGIWVHFACGILTFMPQKIEKRSASRRRAVLLLSHGSGICVACFHSDDWMSHRRCDHCDREVCVLCLTIVADTGERICPECMAEHRSDIG